MSIRDYSLAVGGTISTTGGTSTPVLVKRSDLNSVQMILDDGSAYADETRVNVVTSEPKQNASSPGGYTQRRVSQKIILPFTNADGSKTSMAAEIAINVPVEASPSDISGLRSLIAQVTTSADADDLYDHGSVV